MRTKKYFAVALLGLLTTAPLGADELDQVKVLEHPHYSLLDRITLDLSFTALPLDAFYKPIMLELGASYQFNDLFSWDVVRFGYSLSNINTGLKSSIESQSTEKIKAQGGNQKVVLEDGALKDFRFRVSSHGYLNLLYSKSNFFNKKIVYHQWQVGSGLSYYDMDSKSQIAIDLEARVRFFIDNKWLFHVQGGHSIGFKSGAPKNIMTIGLGAGFAF